MIEERYLRLSVTDECSFRCFYCRSNGTLSPAKKEFLEFDSVVRLAQMLSEYGVRHVRVTGGEPLMRRGVADLVGQLRTIPLLRRVSMTTNGYLLRKNLEDLRRQGLDQINISLDTLRRDRFFALTGVDALGEVQSAIVAARESGWGQVKVNVVVIKNFNDDEVLDFVAYGNDQGVDVRFIEYFPTRMSETDWDHHVPSDMLRRRIEDRFGAMELMGVDACGGPAVYYRCQDSLSRVGFISAVTGDFCRDCSRLRLSCDGRLFVCLHSDFSCDLGEPLKENREDEVKRRIEEALNRKREHNRFVCRRDFAMSAIGG